MKIVEKYSYQPLSRIAKAGGRHYFCPATTQHIPSVTTILDRTADKSGLLEWKKRVGEVEAERIKHEAVGLGTLMHTHLECYVEGRPRPTGTNLVRQQAEAMADQIIKHGLSNVSEVYGSEVGLYSPGLYAGTCDLVAVDNNGELCICDFKTARKLKKLEHILDYEHQLAAYILCHNELYDTNIKKGIIFMVDRDFNYKEFVLEGERFHHKTTEWLDRLERYYDGL